MNILYLCDEYPPGHHGGIGTSVQLLARQMVKMGNKVVVAGLYNPGYGGHDEFEDEGVQVYRFRRGLDSAWFSNHQSVMVRIVIRLLTESRVMEWDIKRSLSAYAIQLESLITKHQIDIVEMPDYNDYVRFCRSFVVFPNLSVPVTVKMHGSITYFKREANQPVGRYIMQMERAILSQAHAVSAVSRYTADKSAGYFSYPHQIEVLYNGIATEVPLANVEKRIKQVIFTGTLTAKKGIYQLAKAWNIVHKQQPDAQLLILGKGPQSKVLQFLNEFAKKSVRFKGHVTKDVLMDDLRASSVSVFPSYAEAFALAPLEAMACQTAVIISNRTSGNELIEDGVNGLLIEPDDVTKLASAILYLLNNPAICLALAKKGNQTLRQRFELGTIAAANLAFYQKVLRGEV